MKNHIYYFLFTCLFFNHARAQKFYINASAGLSLPATKINSGTFSNGNIGVDDKSIYTYQVLPVSFADGKVFSISTGYNFSKLIGLEIQYQKQRSNEFQIHWYDPSYDQNSAIYANTWKVIPSLVINFPTQKIKTYTKFGVNLGRGTIYRKNHYVSPGLNIDQVWNQEINVKQSIGIHSAIGASIPITKHFSLTSEIMISMASLITQSLTTTSFTDNGIDILNDLPISERELLYTDSYNRDYRAPDNLNSPSIRTHEYYSMNGVSFNLGVRFHL